MRASESTYAKVAEHCSAYEPTFQEGSATNHVCESCHCDVSCKCCRHFDKEEYCVLNLYDQIVKEHHFE